MFENDDSSWFVTGGNDSLATEVYNVNGNSFEFSVDLPKTMRYHNLVNVNETHMVVLGGNEISDEVFIMER